MLNIVYLLDVHFLIAVVILTNPFIREVCNILGSRLLVFCTCAGTLKMGSSTWFVFMLFHDLNITVAK